jgi:hypothetical protein
MVFNIITKTIVIVLIKSIKKLIFLSLITLYYINHKKDMLTIGFLQFLLWHIIDISMLKIHTFIFGVFLYLD